MLPRDERNGSAVKCPEIVPRSSCEIITRDRKVPNPYISTLCGNKVQSDTFTTRSLHNMAAKEEGSGDRQEPEVSDEYLTCFEVDKDRILSSSAFRRLARKTQVFAFPEDHLRNRLTHAVEVSQIASRISKATGLNANLAEAIALGHDIGHGPGGHAAEEAFAKFIPDYFRHGPFGADVVLAPMNLCSQTLDGIRNHSWSMPLPATAEALVVSFADRIAYCTHDLEDALSIKLIDKAMLPSDVIFVLGEDKKTQVNTLIAEIIYCFKNFSVIGMRKEYGEALLAFREFNFEFIYNSSEVEKANEMFINLNSQLVEFYIDNPLLLPSSVVWKQEGGKDLVKRAICYVASMTDDYALQLGREFLGFNRFIPYSINATCH